MNIIIGSVSSEGSLLLGGDKIFSSTVVPHDEMSPTSPPPTFERQ